MFLHGIKGCAMFVFFGSNAFHSSFIFYCRKIDINWNNLPPLYRLYIQSRILRVIFSTISIHKIYINNYSWKLFLYICFDTCCLPSKMARARKLSFTENSIISWVLWKSGTRNLFLKNSGEFRDFMP